MAKKKKRIIKKPRLPKVHHQTPISKIRPVKIKGPRYYLKNARDYPILGCWVFAQWVNSGIAPVVVARKQSEDRVIFGVCMIDLWCLEIKDSYANADISLNTFRKNLPKMRSNDPEECSAALTHELSSARWNLPNVTVSVRIGISNTRWLTWYSTRLICTPVPTT